MRDNHRHQPTLTTRISVGQAREAVARRLVWLHRGAGGGTLRWRAVPPYQVSVPYIDSYGATGERQKPHALRSSQYDHIQCSLGR